MRWRRGYLACGCLGREVSSWGIEGGCVGSGQREELTCRVKEWWPASYGGRRDLCYLSLVVCKRGRLAALLDRRPMETAEKVQVDKRAITSPALPWPSASVV